MALVHLDNENMISFLWVCNDCLNDFAYEHWYGMNVAWFKVQ